MTPTTEKRGALVNEARTEPATGAAAATTEAGAELAQEQGSQDLRLYICIYI